MNRWLVVLCALAVGCGGDETPNDDDGVEQGTIALTIDPTSVTLREGSSVEVELTTTLTGGLIGTPVVYAVDGVPAMVHATVQGDTLTLAADMLANNLSTSVTVTATAGDQLAATALALSVAPPLPITVTGTAVAHASGRPLSVADADDAIVVSLWMRGQATPLTVTGSAFSFADVVPPYDLLVEAVYGGVDFRTRQLIIGLTRPDPTVVFFADTPNPPLTTRRMGISSEGIAGGARGALEWVCDDGPSSGSTYGFGSTPGEYAESLIGSTTANASTCHGSGFAYHRVGNFHIDAYSVMTTAELSVDLNANEESYLPLASSLSPPESVTINAAFADAAAQHHATTYWLPNARDSVLLGDANIADLDDPLTSIVVPSDARIHEVLCLSADLDFNSLDPDGRVGVTKCRRVTPGAALDFGGFPAAEPPGAPTGQVDAHMVSFTSGGGFVGYAIDADPSPGELYVFTSRGLDAGVLGAHGVSLASGSNYQWQTMTFEGIGDADAFATMDASLNGLGRRQAGATVSLVQPFTTAEE